MGHRFGQLAGLVAFFLVLARLGRLLQTGPGIPRWHLILLASAFLGGVVWWLIRQMVPGRAATLGLFALGGAVLFLRISVPDSLSGGILPSADTPAALSTTIEQALAQIQHGVPPIVPSEGVIAILALLVWIVGALYAWGVTTGPVIATVLPSIVLYLQFAIFDRSPAGLGWMTASTLMLAMAVTALALERKRDVGRARDAEGRPKPVSSAAAAVVMAVLIGVLATSTANGASGLISEYGHLPWSGDGGGYGLGSGRFALDRFVSLHQRVISRDNLLLFKITYDDRAPDPSQIYWRTETLDTFNGEGWRRSNGPQRQYEPGRKLGDESTAYQGSTVEFTQLFYVFDWGDEIAPTAGVPIAIHTSPLDGAINPTEFQVLHDSALYYPTVFRENDVYEVTSVHPLRGEDLGALATGSDGELSPLFAAAAEAGNFNALPSQPDNEVVAPVNLDYFRIQHDSVTTGVRGLAFAATRGATTDFERAWMLEHFFRAARDEEGEPLFTYSTSVSTGHTALNLDNWLNDSTSLNYRIGYCEQFATAMAVMGRELDIPTRVILGFTPGAVKVEGKTPFVEIRDRNAHAWVEMWIDGFGWVQFDPTPRGDSLPASVTSDVDLGSFIDEQRAADSIGGPGGIRDEGLFGPGDIPDPVGFAEPGPRWWLVIVIIIPLLISIIPAAKALRRQRRIRMIRDGDITAAWDELVDRLEDLGEPIPASKTPVEFARETDSALLPIATSYSATVYGGREGQAEESDLYGVETWMQSRYDGADRLRAAVNPRSLLRRD